MTSSLPGKTIRIAGKTVSRLGLGTMRLTGAGTWGDPDDRGQGLSVLRQAVHTYGITHIDTADAYGPHTVEELIADALHPYPDELLVATKVGLLRPAPNVWAPHGHPAYLRACVEASLRRLKAERLELCPAKPLTGFGASCPAWRIHSVSRNPRRWRRSSVKSRAMSGQTIRTSSRRRSSSGCLARDRVRSP
ncbi:aldo/keto reductase [Streptomyces sp. NPDC055006]